VRAGPTPATAWPTRPSCPIRFPSSHLPCLISNEHVSYASAVHEMRPRIVIERKNRRFRCPSWPSTALCTVAVSLLLSVYLLVARDASPSGVLAVIPHVLQPASLSSLPVRIAAISAPAPSSSPTCCPLVKKMAFPWLPPTFYMFFERTTNPSNPSHRPLRLWRTLLYNTPHGHATMKRLLDHVTPDDVVYISTTWHQDGDIGIPLFILSAPCQIVFLACSREELRSMSRAGLRVIFVHHNAFLDENVLYLDASVKEELRVHSLIVNSRFDTVKRLELAADVEAAIFVGSLFRDKFPSPSVYNLTRRAVNFVNGTFRKLDPAAVTRLMHSAHLGGIFSELEGGNYATTEYLLCGLPVISTPSKGGRDEYFDDTNSIIVDATTSAVAAGVEAGLARLRAGSFNRSAIREGALARNAAFRAVFLDDVSRVLREHGVPPSEATAHGIFSQAYTHKLLRPVNGAAGRLKRTRAKG
jgi:hypothetical protein